MLNKAYAWYELTKLGNASRLKNELESFTRGNVIKILDKEEWFEYLKEPRTMEELMGNYGYSDKEFLKHILEVLVKDKALNRLENQKYKTLEPLDKSRVVPSIFDEQIESLWTGFANYLPERLHGKYYEFSGGFNLFKWDNALNNNMYDHIRNSAFAYVSGLNKCKKFLDVGCGNGFGTSAIWSYFIKKNNLNKVEVIGIDRDQDLLNIATNEFERMARKITGLEINQIKKYSENYPKFIKGDVLEIPFPDNTFDFTYASQVLHWTDGKQALKEMVRVTKKNGTIFGTQSFYPGASEFTDLHFKVIKGASGYFTQKEFIAWAKECNVKSIKFATPITVFAIVK